ncbi:hypothetical protein [Pseudomonas sp.]|uniref:hypothetical protein n=1 Tax=Pseudomonas sp. TaxID=306 RepID=UPI0028AC1537|nr:hypothetical protein [Pseudomonas sp.]
MGVIKNDLVTTALQLESLRTTLDGHARYLQRMGQIDETAAMATQVDKLRMAAEDLRQVAAGIRP